VLSCSCEIKVPPAEAGGVSQYPKGTTFLFGSDRPDTADEQRVFDELSVYLEKYERKLSRFDADKKPE
jgi:hypothetical protein